MASTIGKGHMVPCAAFQGGPEELGWSPECKSVFTIQPGQWIGELCSRAHGGNTDEHCVSWRNTRHHCQSLKSVNLGKDKHTGGWKVPLGSDLQTKDWLSQKLSLNFSSINLSTEVSISFLFIPVFSERLHQPFRVTRLKRLGIPLCLARLFYVPETLLLFWLSGPGAAVVGRRQTALQSGQVISCPCSGRPLEEPKAERLKI